MEANECRLAFDCMEPTDALLLILFLPRLRGVGLNVVRLVLLDDDCCFFGRHRIRLRTLPFLRTLVPLAGVFSCKF